MIEIKPCPFCLGPGDTFFKPNVLGSGKFWWTVECNDKCMAVGPLMTTEADAIEAWNRRPVAPAAPLG